MFGLSLLFKMYAATISFMIAILILTNQVLLKPNSNDCLPVSVKNYFCTNGTDGGSKDCFDAFLALYPALLGFFCVFAISGHLWYSLKNERPNCCDWVLSSFYVAAWFIAFAIMCYVCVNKAHPQYPVQDTWIIAATFCFLLVVIFTGEIVVILRKPEIYYGLSSMSSSGSLVAREPKRPVVLPPPVHQPLPIIADSPMPPIGPPPFSMPPPTPPPSPYSAPSTFQQREFGYESPGPSSPAPYDYYPPSPAYSSPTYAQQQQRQYYEPGSSSSPTGSYPSVQAPPPSPASYGFDQSRHQVQQQQQQTGGCSYPSSNFY